MFRSEFTEIMVTRRYYRFGRERVFPQQKALPPSKDVHELRLWIPVWAATAIPASGQGRIDEICPSRARTGAKSLRKPQASPKFRYRKEEAERRLSATEENLVRIRDLYGELENRLEPLEAAGWQGEKVSASAG